MSYRAGFMVSLILLILTFVSIYFAINFHNEHQMLHKGSQDPSVVSMSEFKKFASVATSIILCILTLYIFVSTCDLLSGHSQEEWDEFLKWKKERDDSRKLAELKYDEKFGDITN